MNARTSSNRLRCLGVAALAPLLTVPPLVPLITTATTASGDVSAPLVRTCAALLSGCLLWALAAVLAAVADAWRGAPAARLVGVPRPIRGMVLAACGVALTGGLGGPAQAATEHGPPLDTVTTSLSGLPLPERVSGDAPTLAPPPAPEHVVRPGETLWAIAAATLAADAPAQQVDARWREIHRLNRAAIGDDPDLIRPGVPLTLPEEGDPR